ncbi:MAG: HDIG domain-containing protein [Ignavibacteria bacterium]|jgi:putative nucleotidyltransferase with HDIG domain|nr:HDIG domain-containing protein [Ignavibacteria bacterium]
MQPIIKEKKDYEISSFHHSKVIKVVIISVTILLCSLFSFLNYKKSILESDKDVNSVGNIWTDPTLVADHSFSVYKPKPQYDAEVKNARDSVIPVFLLNKQSEKNLIEKLSGDIREAILQHSDVVLQQYATNEHITRFFNQPEAIQNEVVTKIKNSVVPFLKRQYKRGYIDQLLDRFKINNVLSIRELSNTDYLIEKDLAIDRQKFSIELQRYCEEIFNEQSAQFIEDIVFKLSQPNLIFSDELTERSAVAAEQSVRRTIGIVHTGDKIVERGHTLTSEKLLIIRSYRDSNIASENDQHYMLIIIGCIGHSLVLCSILLIFLAIIRKRIWASNLQLLIICIAPVFVSFLAWLTFYLQSTAVDAPIEYLVPIPALAMFVAIVFDSRTAFYTTVVMAMLLAGVRGNDYFLGLTMLFTGSIAAYAVKDVEDRTQMFSSILYIFIGFVISIFVIGFQRVYEFDTMMPQLFLGLINAILAPIITFGLLMIINRFSTAIITNLKLHEYVAKEHPLVTELRERARGTFEHSREVAHLATMSAVAIDANKHLVYAGAMFHDIGKLDNPQLFTENKEQYKIDLHAKMTPKQSAAAIIKHVEDGIRKAEIANLPQCIIDFIPQHHGTTLVKHFYNVSLNNSKDSGDIVNKDDYRYPGPKPQTKEAAILMLCDTAEALSKSTPDSEQFVSAFNAIIDDRIKCNQFDDADITIKEIKIVKETIINELKGKIATREKYAEAEPETTANADES